jgi:tRNA (uracil-5-)-methyltransferase TRM9
MNQEEVWDAIAEPWEKFRNERPLTEVIKFLHDVEGKVLDVACGSGRHLLKIPGIEWYATDFSGRMIELTLEYMKKKGIECVTKKSDASELPFEGDFFDAAIFIAALHCIDAVEKREAAVKELFRVLKPKGRALITVWSKNHERVKTIGENYIPWSVNGKKYQRFYYIYIIEELKELLEKVGFRIISMNEKENIAAIVEKQ